MSNVSGGGDGLIPNSSLYSDINNMKPSGLIRLLSICCVLAPFTLDSKDLSKPNIVANKAGYRELPIYRILTGNSDMQGPAKAE